MAAFIFIACLFFSGAFAFVSPMSAQPEACVFAALVLLIAAPVLGGLQHLFER